MKLGSAVKGETITITFPMQVRKTVEKAWTLEYSVKWCGDDVIHIDPAGTYYPLYNNRKVHKKTPIKTKALVRSQGGLYI